MCWKISEKYRNTMCHIHWFACEPVELKEKFHVVRHGLKLTPLILHEISDETRFWNLGLDGPSVPCEPDACISKLTSWWTLQFFFLIPDFLFLHLMWNWSNLLFTVKHLWSYTQLGLLLAARECSEFFAWYSCKRLENLFNYTNVSLCKLNFSIDSLCLGVSAEG